MGIYKDIAQTIVGQCNGAAWNWNPSPEFEFDFWFHFRFLSNHLVAINQPQSALSYTVLQFHTHLRTHTIRSTRFGVMFFFFHKLFYLLFFAVVCFVLFVFFSIFVYVFSVFWWLPLKLNKRMFIIYIFI